MTAIVITNCSKRKRTSPIPALCASSLQRGTLESICQEWVARINSASPISEAGQLYRGRQFHLSSCVAKDLNAELLIVSAGLGVVRSSDFIPCYNLTVASGSSDSILRVVEPRIDASSWWKSLSQISERIVGLQASLALTKESDGLILIALPAPYLEMIGAELEKLSPRCLTQIRIFTGQSFRFRNSRLNRHLMPYDARLDGPDSPIPGTATDFTSRALRDFVSFVLQDIPDAMPEEHAEAVARRLEPWAVAVRPERKRQSDADLMKIIRANWDTAGASRSRMLRWLRSELGLACEQGRMQVLYAAVRKEMEASS